MWAAYCKQLRSTLHPSPSSPSISTSAQIRHVTLHIVLPASRKYHQRRLCWTSSFLAGKLDQVIVLKAQWLKLLTQDSSVRSTITSSSWTTCFHNTSKELSSSFRKDQDPQPAVHSNRGKYFTLYSTSWCEPSSRTTCPKPGKKTHAGAQTLEASFQLRNPYGAVFVISALCNEGACLRLPKNSFGCLPQRAAAHHKLRSNA